MFETFQELEMLHSAKITSCHQIIAGKKLLPGLHKLFSSGGHMCSFVIPIYGAYGRGNEDANPPVGNFHLRRRVVSR